MIENDAKMGYIATIEIPKGTDRRIHMSFDRSGFVDLGHIKDHIPVNEGVMPVDYGYIDGTLNKDEVDEVDVLVFSKNAYSTGDKVEIEILGMLIREDGDHKVIARDSSESDLVFQELAQTERQLIIDYIGYKSPVRSIDTKTATLEYVKKSIESARL